MMDLLIKSWSKLGINVERAFKSLFVTNALDGSEDHLVSDNLFSLIGPAMVQFRSKLMTELPIKTLREVVRKLIPPKGVRRGATVEGSELFDCVGQELDISEVDDILDNEITEGDEEITDQESDSTSTAAAAPQQQGSEMATSIALSPLSNDPDIAADSKFLESFHELLLKQKTSRLFTPYISQFKATYQKQGVV